jgi:hypothetical protein
VAEGLLAGKVPGDWYGVNTIANIVCELNQRYRPVKGFKICSFNDGNMICEVID